MIKVENIEIFNFEAAIRGCRNPMNSWDKSDSKWCIGCAFIDCKTTSDICIRKDDSFEDNVYCVGKADLDLMKRLYKAGTEHRKYLRQIFVSLDIIAPLYWWKEFDTYKIGTTSNSCSTMHKIAAKEFTLDDFSHEHLTYRYSDGDDDYGLATWAKKSLLDTIETLNRARDIYLRTKNKKHWWVMIQLLPSSYNQRRTITMNYENVANIIHQRTGHKLDEWNNFVEILKDLPYVKEIME